MKCIECTNEFNPINKRGVEQKYCSLKCRNKSAFKRREERLKNTFFSLSDNYNNKINNNENDKERITGTEQIGITECMGRIGRRISETNERRGDSSNSILSNYKESRRIEGDSSRYAINGVEETHINLIRELYESRSETIFYKLKNEQLEKEVNELRIENAQLESELDELYESDNEDSETEYSGMLGGIMEQFKTDPVNTINFTSELIGNLFKPKV